MTVHRPALYLADSYVPHVSRFELQLVTRFLLKLSPEMARLFVCITCALLALLAGTTIPSLGQLVIGLL